MTLIQNISGRSLCFKSINRLETRVELVINEALTKHESTNLLKELLRVGKNQWASKPQQVRYKNALNQLQ